MVDEAIGKVLSPENGMPLVTYAYSSVTKDPAFSVLDVTAGLMPGTEPKDVVMGILDAVHSISSREFTDEELRNAVAADRRQELFFSEQVQYGAFLLVPKLALAPWGFWSSYEQARDEVSVRDAAAVATRWFAQPFWVASAYLPRGDESTGEGITLGEVKVDTLDNGLVVAVRQVANAPVAGIHLVVKNRALLEGDDHRGWVDVLQRLLAEDDADRLDKRMNEIGMDMTTVDNPMIPMDDYRTVPDYSYVRIQAVADGWAGAVSLLADRLNNSIVDPDAMQDAVTELQGIIDRGKGNVSGIASSTFDDRLYGGNIEAMPVYGDGASLQNICPADLQNFRKEVFAPNNMILTILAPAPAEEIIGRVQDAFKGMKEQAIDLEPNPAPMTTPGDTTVSGRGRQGYLATGFLLTEVDAADRAALLVANNMISDLIYRDLGEKRGWAYGAGSGLTLRPGWGAWHSSMGLPEDHLEEARDAIYDHVKRIASGDIDEKRLAVAKGDLRGRVLRRYSSRINLAMAMGRDLALWNDPLHTWEQYDAVQQVSLDDVKRVAKKYLAKPDGVVTVFGTPEKSNDTKKRPPEARSPPITSFNMKVREESGAFSGEGRRQSTAMSSPLGIR